jgi:hypothetical protein
MMDSSHTSRQNVFIIVPLVRHSLPTVMIMPPLHELNVSLSISLSFARSLNPLPFMLFCFPYASLSLFAAIVVVLSENKDKRLEVFRTGMDPATQACN